MKRILPAEWLLLAALTLALLLHYALGYPFVTPDLKGGLIMDQLLATQNYFKLIGGAIAILLLTSMLRSMQRDGYIFYDGMGRDLLAALRLMIVFIASLYLMQNFKYWSHLRGVYYDEMYQSIDIKVAAAINFLHSLDQTLGIPHIWYFRGFALSFMVVYWLLAAFNFRLFMAAITANILIMLVGGALYMAAPAYGPFIYTGGSPEFQKTQLHMLTQTQTFVAASKDPAGTVSVDMEAALGAMPSLHIAHMIALNYFIMSISLFLGTLFMGATLFIGAYAIITGFHYAIDLPAGIALAAFAIWFSVRFCLRVSRMHKKRIVY